MTENTDTKKIRTLCRECGVKCGMLVQVKEGRAVKLESDPDSPKSKDQLCWKADAALERLYHPDRLKTPLKRVGKRGEGKWQEISWDEALDTIAGTFNTLKLDHGPESVALVKGHYERRCDLVSRLGNAFGTPNIASIDNTCYIPSASGRLMTYGFDGHPDFSGAPECILCWGTSVLPPLGENTVFIVVDSIRTEAAERADVWLQPRPGSDLALALGLLHVIVNEKRYDSEFVENWTVGFDELEKHLQQYTPHHVAEITWVPSDKIVKTARLFTESRHACLDIGNASEDTYNSTQFARATSIIQAICGLLDIPGGTVQSRGVPIDFEGSGTDVLCNLLPPEQMKRKLGAEAGHYPADPLWDTIVNKPAELQPQYLVDSILDRKPYQVQAALVIGSNPVMTWCNSKRVFEAFKTIPFSAVVDIFMTPTALLADIVLPAATYLESDGVAVSSVGLGDTCIQAQQKTVQIGECRSDPDIIISLANRMGLEEYFWKDLPTYLDDYLKEMGMTFNELRRCNRIIPSGTRYRKYLENGFGTPSGKVEIVSSLCEKWGFEPLPTYHEPNESPFSVPELAKTYPLIVTSAHDKNYTHSQDRNLKTLRESVPKPLVAIHPKTAAEYGITEGDPVFIENRRGRILQYAALSEKVDPRVIDVAYGWWFPEKGAAAEYGWEESNINVLTSDSPPYSPEIGSPSMRGFMCSIRRAE